MNPSAGTNNIQDKKMPRSDGVILNPSLKNSRARNYTVTIFGTVGEQEKLLDKSSEAISYFIGKWELCPSTKKTHIQGYLELNDKMSIKQIKKITGFETAHLEERRGTQQQAIDYCLKKETAIAGLKVITWGTPKAQGKRSDLEAVATDIKAGKNLREIVEAHMPVYIKYHKGIEKSIIIMGDKPRQEKTEVIWIIGEPGIGKSTKAQTLAGPNAYWKNNTKWWDGYNFEEVVVWDEINTNVYDDETWLKLFDKYPMKVEYKGGCINFNSKKIIITSNYYPQCWETLRFNRRITKEYMKDDKTETKKTS